MEQHRRPTANASPKFLLLFRVPAKTWCIANPLARPAALQRDIDSLCNGIVDCSSIQPGGSCYNPNTVADHASVALNLNYKNHQSQQQFCTGDGFITVSNPCKNMVHSKPPCKPSCITKGHR
ncbi:hypothetical protein ZIOFF_031293 [Zingiber officinale]|uniref:X8 domain-containing protein n=1 Tax=Zingiber officinale TaxID=94328 RepID=A0A8J5GCY3_ZINOF|nr:hypothetical protein ZIOFF_031293 [Zingiber officinale]